MKDLSLNLMICRVQSRRENKNIRAQAKLKDQMSPVQNNQYQYHHLKCLSWTKLKISVTLYLIRSILMIKAKLYLKKIKAIDKKIKTRRANAQINLRRTECMLTKYQTRKKRKLKKGFRNLTKLKMMTKKKPEDYQEHSCKEILRKLLLD